MHILEQRIHKATLENRFALIPFITAGFPKKSSFLPVLEELDECGADIIEIGIPFSDPVADGPVVEAASLKALENGVTLRWVIEQLSSAKPCRAGIVLVGYYNPFLQYGLEKLAHDAQAARVEGFIVPDLPFEESELFRTILKEKGMSLITLVGHGTTEDRMRKYASFAEGYVYIVSALGATGLRTTQAPDVDDFLKRARRAFGTLPLALELGVQRPEQLVGTHTKPDAVILGGALIKRLEEGKSLDGLLSCWQLAAE